jgi:hypothetical protein
MLVPSPDRPFLPPRTAKFDDFNYILRQCPATRFSAGDSDNSILIFEKESEIPGIRAGAPFTMHLLHTVFLVRGSKAVQLEVKDTSVLSKSSFRVGAQIGRSNELIVERDLNIVHLSDSSERWPRRSYSFRKYGTEHLAGMEFHPIPAYPRVLLHHESMGYVCFAFERMGAYPKATVTALGTTGIRGFQSTSRGWEEFEVESTRLTTGGLNNLSFDTALGSFFIPGDGSVGDPTLDTKRGSKSETLRFVELYLEDLQDPKSPGFNVDAHRALRNLGLPAQWPPPEFLSS